MRHRRGNGDYNLYSILFTVCEVAFDNFFIKEFYDDAELYIEQCTSAAVLVQRPKQYIDLYLT